MPQKSHSTDMMTRAQTAAHLTELGYPISISTLAKLAVRDNAGSGPPFLRSGWRTVRYRRVDVDLWAAKHIVRVD